MLYDRKDNNEELLFEDKYLKILSENVSRIRKIRGLTIQNLSDRTGLTVNYLAKISSNSKSTKKIPTLRTILKISLALSITPDELFKETNNK